MFRWSALALLAGALLVSAFHRTRASAEKEELSRTQESGWLMALRAAVGLALFGSTAAYLVHPPVMGWSSFEPPVWLRLGGVGVGVVALAGVYWTLSTLGSNVSGTVLTADEQELVTDGPYRWVRHPLYTSGFTLFAGVGLTAANWCILGAALFALLAIRIVVVPREERELVDRFGTEYEQYMERTGALVPWF